MDDFGSFVVQTDGPAIAPPPVRTGGARLTLTGGVPVPLPVYGDGPASPLVVWDGQRWLWAGPRRGPDGKPL